MTKFTRHAVAFLAALLITAATFTETLAVPGARSRPATAPTLV